MATKKKTKKEYTTVSPEAVKSCVLLDKKDGYELSRILYEDRRVKFTIVTDGQRTAELHEFETYWSALPFWKTVHTIANTAERNRHFKTIESKVKDIEADEADPHEPMFGGDEASTK